MSDGTARRAGAASVAAAPALRVLVVEDEAIIGMLLERILAGMGHDVIGVAATEEEAVAAATRIRPDLILVDERLRAGSGHGAIERILRGGFIPHVWMSGNKVLRANVAPGVAVLQKPFTEHALGLAIAQAVGPKASAPPASEAVEPGSDAHRSRD